MNLLLKRILGASLILTAFSFVTHTTAQAQSCAVAPTCESLGYTKSESDCGSQNMLRCPFDASKVFCGSETSEDNCHAGSFLYEPAICADWFNDSTRFLGVVFDPQRRLYAPAQFRSSYYSNSPWEKTNGFPFTPISGLSIKNKEEAKLDFDGEANTQKIQTYMNSGVWDAIFSAKPYFLSVGELLEIFKYKDQINFSMEFTPKGDGLPSDCYWSSTLAPCPDNIDSSYCAPNGYAWAVYPDGRIESRKKDASCFVLELIKY